MVIVLAALLIAGCVQNAQERSIIGPSVPNSGIPNLTKSRKETQNGNNSTSQSDK
jgi:hypothetical protein